MLRVVAVFLGLVMIAPVLAQNSLPSVQIDLKAIKAFTGDDRTGNPYGLGLTVSKRLRPNSFLRLELSYLKRREDRSETVYESSPYSGVSEQVWMNENYHLRSAEICLMRTISRGEFTFLNVGAGLVLADRSAKWRVPNSDESFEFGGEMIYGVTIAIDLLLLSSKLSPFVTRFGFSHRFLTEGFAQTHITGSRSVFLDWGESITTTEFSFSIGWIIAQ